VTPHILQVDQKRQEAALQAARALFARGHPLVEGHPADPKSHVMLDNASQLASHLPEDVAAPLQHYVVAATEAKHVLLGHLARGVGAPLRLLALAWAPSPWVATTTASWGFSTLNPKP